MKNLLCKLGFHKWGTTHTIVLRGGIKIERDYCLICHKEHRIITNDSL